MCLMMCETPIEARAATNFCLNQPALMYDDFWMMHFGCNQTRILDSYVHLPEDHAVFDTNFEQKAPLEIRDRRFIQELKSFINMWHDTYGKDIIKKPKS